jgi:hypothetical protein
MNCVVKFLWLWEFTQPLFNKFVNFITKPLLYEFSWRMHWMFGDRFTVKTTIMFPKLWNHGLWCCMYNVILQWMDRGGNESLNVAINRLLFSVILCVISLFVKIKSKKNITENRANSAQFLEINKKLSVVDISNIFSPVTFNGVI